MMQKMLQSIVKRQIGRHDPANRCSFSRFRLISSRKKGDVLLLSLATMILLFILIAVILNIVMLYLTDNRVQQAADLGARTRAQAVDIPLKEMTGYIEAYHAADAPTGPYQENGVSHTDPTDVTTGQPILDTAGNIPLETTTSDTYQNAYQMANLAAQQAVYDDLVNQFGPDNTSGDTLIDNFTTANVCIDVEPLPATPSPITFSCTFASDHKTFTQTVNVLGLSQTKIQIASTPIQYEQVMNAVFIAVEFQPQSFIFQPLSSLGWLQPPESFVWAVAYPQIDACSRAFATTNCPPELSGN